MKLTTHSLLVAAIWASAPRTHAQECPLFGEDPLGGHTLVHGDVLVPPQYFEEAGFTVNSWAGGVIRYFVENSVDATELSQIESAMADWEAVANVDFARYYAHTGAHVHIRESNAGEFNFSGIGQGTYTIGITDWDDHGVLLHELGHTLGYWHEQSRPDRDSFVSIRWDHIDPDHWHNFEIEPSASTYGDYDFDSIMHYWSCAFSTCANIQFCSQCTSSCWTIEPLVIGPAVCSFGVSGALSDLDRLTMSFIYPEPDWRFLDAGYTGSQSDGSFRFPYKSFFVASAGTPDDGTLWIQPGSYNAIGTYTRAMTLAAPLGDVVLR